jgi:hypothetical protein
MTLLEMHLFGFTVLLRRFSFRVIPAYLWQYERIRLSNAPVVRLRLVLNLSDERSGISTEAAESGRGGEAGCGA